MEEKEGGPGTRDSEAGSPPCHVPVQNSEEFQDFKFEPNKLLWWHIYQGRRKGYILF